MPDYGHTCLNYMGILIPLHIYMHIIYKSLLFYKGTWFKFYFSNSNIPCNESIKQLFRKAFKTASYF